MAILRTERLRSLRRLLPLLPRGERIAGLCSFVLLFFDGALNRDVPELGLLVNLAIPIRFLYGISVRGNGCCSESPARGIIITGGAL
jgi:hypothetical protein